MTDDEIRADLLRALAKRWSCRESEIAVLETECFAYRAGMREAARIARLYEWSRAAAVHIERAAGGEG
jgi:hypothetical protein